MNASLASFFALMADYFDDRLSTDELLSSHEGWTEDPARLELYRGFVQAHGREILDKLYPLSRSALDAPAWEALCAAYVEARPSRHFELNASGEGFPAFLADEASARGLPPFLPALARFEWADFAVYAAQCSEQVSSSGQASAETGGAIERAARADPERRWSVNPTLEVLEHPFRLCAWVRGPEREQPPALGEERALLWRHPGELRTYFVEADERLLLGLKVVVDGLALDDTERALGWATGDLEQLLEEMVHDGLLVRGGSQPGVASGR